MDSEYAGTSYEEVLLPQYQSFIIIIKNIPWKC